MSHCQAVFSARLRSSSLLSRIHSETFLVLIFCPPTMPSATMQLVSIHDMLLGISYIILPGLVDLFPTFSCSCPMFYCFDLHGACTLYPSSLTSFVTVVSMPVKQLLYSPNKSVNLSSPSKPSCKHTSPRSILQQCRVYRRTRQVHIAHHAASDKHILNGRLKPHRSISNASFQPNIHRLASLALISSRACCGSCRSSSPNAGTSAPPRLVYHRV